MYCVSEVQVGGNITVYINVCLRFKVREILICTVMFSDVQGEGNGTVYRDVSEVQNEGYITVYSDMFLRYRLREILLRKLICV